LGSHGDSGVERHYDVLIRKSNKTEEIMPEQEEIKDAGEETEKMTLLVFAGDLDKALGAFIIATGAAAMDIEVHMFFAFWGLNALRREKYKTPHKDFLSRMFGWMMPKGANKLKLSKMNMIGLGTSMMKRVMSKKNVMSLPDLIRTAQDLGVKFTACEMSMNVMGLRKEELLDGVKLAGVATALATASESKTSLFIS
jgi:peroxiredoxin family protein